MNMSLYPLNTTNVKIELSENFKLTDGGKYRRLSINDVDIYITEGQAEQLTEELESKMYDELTYKQLADKCDSQQAEIDRLNEKIDCYKEQLKC